MLTDIRLQGFRLYEDATFEFKPGVNIIVGANGSGKTSLLEAVELLCRGKSHKGSDGDILGHEAEWYRLQVHGENIDRVVKYDPQKQEKTFIIGEVQYKRLSPLKRLPVVVFEPSHLQLLTESPSKRRDFIDDIIEQTSPQFYSARRQYKRVLTQRNTLLKQNPTEDQLFVWDIRLSEFGGVIYKERQAFIENNNDALEKLYKKISKQNDIVHLNMETTIHHKDYMSGMVQLLKVNKQQDIMRGFTTVGPHRDDIIPTINKYELSRSGSRGEIRTSLLAIKILELQALEKAAGKPPLLLLDDVFSELDGARRRALTSYLKDHQTFITTTDADVVVQHFIDDCHVIPLN